MLKRTDFLTKVYGKPNGWTREQVVDEAKKANLRGRGGAGFPMGERGDRAHFGSFVSADRLCIAMWSVLSLLISY